MYCLIPKVPEPHSAITHGAKPYPQAQKATQDIVVHPGNFRRTLDLTPLEAIGAVKHVYRIIDIPKPQKNMSFEYLFFCWESPSPKVC